MPGPSWPDRIHHLLYEALIVPSAHTRVFDAGFQLEMYEVFHTTSVTRWGHLLCTPIANISLLAAATALPFVPVTQFGGLTLDGAALAALITLAFYVAVHGAWAFVMTPVLMLAVGMAQILTAALGPRVVPGGLAIAVGAALVQTFSHAFEPVPPPWSGSHRWISFRDFLVRTPPLKLVLLAMVSLLVFPLLELWASPRIWPVQVIHLTMRAGLRPALARRMGRRVQSILGDARNGWTVPPLESTDADCNR